MTVQGGVSPLAGGGGLRETIDAFRTRSALLPADAWYPAGFQHGAVATGNSALVVNTLLAMPFHFVTPQIVRDIGCRLTVNGGAGSLIRLGIYQSDPTTLYPTARIFDSGNLVADAGAPVLRSAAVNLRIAGLVWLTYVAGIGGPAPSVLAFAGAAAAFFGLSNAGVQQTGLFVAFPFAALPATFPAGGAFATTNNNLIIMLRI